MISRKMIYYYENPFPQSSSLMDEWLERTTINGIAYRTGWLGCPGDSLAPVLLFAHGAGFNASTWEPVVDALLREWASMPVEIVAFDWTGHGLSRPLAGEGLSPERCDWSAIGPRDIEELLEEIDCNGRPVYGIGHSFGGGCLVLAELARRGTFAGLILLEPILRAEIKTEVHPLVQVALRRRVVVKVCDSWPALHGYSRSQHSANSPSHALMRRRKAGKSYTRISPHGCTHGTEMQLVVTLSVASNGMRALKPSSCAVSPKRRRACTWVACTLALSSKGSTSLAAASPSQVDRPQSRSKRHGTPICRFT